MGIFKTILNIIPRPWLIKASFIAKPILAIYYKGNTYTDPIDQKSYRKFLSYGYKNQRENVLAPGTLSLERHRLLWLYLNDHSDFFKQPKKVLHVAPEQCFYKIFRDQKNLTYTTTDLFSPLADVKADICDLPFADNSYDVIFCNHVLEHIADDTKAMSELYRVLKPGGWGIFQVPQDVTRSKTYEDFSITEPKERQKHFGQYDHVRIYGLDYFKRLENVGFNVIQFKTAQHFSETDIIRYALMKNEILPICIKPNN
ncbi:putative SAM-dependent methyltransferase [Wenyingzhuangia heitensis]|uniref:SAM-dependent methyltransferase n=1 Tax=Wenyingzhuangia heitensis TaxID=1487859 RepID=A0ABX0U4K1_9FLAO|nr:class I SAM-dependent methyltransferase [Wenyingzhuangia heitensis]NIJ43792.1 putative SAM-dependent methyltransferase [Wenyingzhuangia heitensis]